MYEILSNVIRLCQRIHLFTIEVDELMRKSVYHLDEFDGYRNGICLVIETINQKIYCLITVVNDSNPTAMGCSLR